MSRENGIFALVKKPPGSWQDPAKNPVSCRDPAGILPARVFFRRDPVRKKNPALDPAGTPTANLCLPRDPAKNPDYPEIPPGSCQPGYFPTGTPTGNLCLHRDPATNPDYLEILPGSCQPGYFPAGIPSGKNSRSDSCRESLSSRGSRQGNKIFPGRCFVLMPAWTKLRRFRNSVKRSKIVAIETNLFRRE